MKRLNWSQEQRTALGLTHVLNQVQTASPLSRQRLLQCDYFRVEDKTDRVRYFQNMKQLKDVMTSSKKMANQVFCELSDLRPLSPILVKLTNKLDLDVTDLFILKKHVTLEQRLLSHVDVLKAAGIKLTDHAKVLALLSGTRPNDVDAPVRLALSDYDDSELKRQRAVLADLQGQLADSDDAASLHDLFQGIEAVESMVVASERRVLSWLGKNLVSFIDTLSLNLERLLALDLMMAKVRLGEQAGNESVQVDNRRLVFEDVSHPEETDRLESIGRCFTCLSLSIKPGVTVIQGANMSGKSVALNTALLNALLVNMGFFPYAKKARVPLFDDYVWIGDVKGDRIQGLSTFGAEVDKIRQAVDIAAENQILLMIDEPFRGTNPEEGQLLASGLTAYVNALPSFTLIATHFKLNEEKKYRRYRSGDIDVPDGLTKNYDQAVRMLSERVDYQLRDITGEKAVPQKAMAIAGWLGLQAGILDRARQYKEEALENTYGNTKSKSRQDK